MRLSITALAVLSVVSLCGCHEAQTLVGPLSPTTSPDYAVYDGVLLGLFDNRTSTGEPTRYVLIDSTMRGGDVIDVTAPSGTSYLRRALAPEFGTSTDEVLSDYIAKSTPRIPLDVAAFHVAPRIELLRQLPANSSAGAAPRNPGTFWSDFYARYPGSRGYISFSRPGYDSSRTHALVSYGHTCGGLCGDWGFVLLERRGEQWVVLRRVLTASA